MHNLDSAILKTLIYGDIFHFPMTVQEIHHFLIYNEIVDFDDIQQQLNTSKWLQSQTTTDGIYYALSMRSELFKLRHEREKMMETLSPQMRFYGRVLSYFPFVELVGITGALSMRNPSTATDDLDYLIITRPGRVWLSRAMIIVLVRIIRLRGIEICPNYFLASDQLVQARQDLYIAHEIAQLLPLSNLTLYRKLRDLNRWTETVLPNADQPFYDLLDAKQNIVGLVFKRGLELILSLPIGDWLEQWEYRRKAQRFQQQAQEPTASAEIDEGHVKGHFEDYGHYVLDRYNEQLGHFDIEQDKLELQSAGD